MLCFVGDLVTFGAKPTSEASEPEDLFVYGETASDREGAWLVVGGLGGSAVSPLGKIPSANHTLRCSRVSDPAGKRHAEN